MTRRTKKSSRASHGNERADDPPAPSDDELKRKRRAVSRKFLIVFVGLLVVFQGVFQLWLAESSLFLDYLHWNAVVSAAVLTWLGETTTAAGDVLQSSRGALGIRRGCDAIQPCAIFAAGVLAFPSGIKAKVWGLLCGCAVLLATNLLRIVTLYFVRIEMPGSFDLAHEAVWPAAFIALAMILWMLWIFRIPRPAAPAV